MRKIFRQKTRLFQAGLMLFVSCLSINHSFAESRQKVIKDPSLVAFYNHIIQNDKKTTAIKKSHKKQSPKVSNNRAISHKQTAENCVSYPNSSENEFALNLKREKEQQNLSLLMSDSKIIEQTEHVKSELNRIKHINTELLLDLVQKGENSAQINLGHRKTRCKKAPPTAVKKIIKKTPKAKKVPKIIVKPKPKKLKQVLKPVEVTPPAPPIEEIQETPIENVIEEKKEEVIVEKKEPIQILKKEKPKPSIVSACSASSHNAVAPANAAPSMDDLFAKAFGKKTTVVAPTNVTVGLRINTSINLGDIELFSNSSGTIDQADTETLITLLEEVLKEEFFIKVKTELEKSTKTRFCTLNDLGLITVYNSTNLSLDIEIDPKYRKPQILSLLSKKKASVREENKVEAEKISGFLNVYTTVGLNSLDDEADFKMRLEGSLNLGGAVFQTKTDYRNKTFDLGKTTLTYDRSEKLQRFTLGNISTGSRNFQENFELDGIRISKEFFLDPDLQITPKANESITLDTNSEVELFINNQLIKRFYLRAGVYSLQDIGLYDGANNIRIRIKDEFGKVTVKTSQQYYDSHLLKPGLSLYAFSVGYLSNQQSYKSEALEKKAILSGYYQRGISKDLTLGFDAQLSTENYLLGAESIKSIPIGSIKNSIAISGGKDRENGYATSFEFKPNKKHQQISLDTLRQDLLGLETRSRSFLSNWSVTGEFRSEHFSVLNGIDPSLTGSSQEISGVNFGSRVFNNNKLKANLQTNFGLNINKDWQGTLNLGAAYYHDSDDSYYANLSASRRFNNGTRLNLAARYDTEDEFSMNLQLSVPLSRKKYKNKLDFNVLADSRDKAYETKLSLKPSSAVGKNSLSGSLEHFQGIGSTQQQLDFQYRDRNFESKFTARNRSSNNSKSTQTINLGFNTAIACLGIGCATTYPINDSFALVTGPSNQTKPIALSNNGLRFKYSDGNDTGLPDNYTALIPAKGKKAVVRLESYRVQNINIDEGTLPDGYNTEKTEFSVFPKYHQGFLVKAGGEPATVLDGMLLDEQKKALPFKGGQWVPLNDEKGKAVAFFSNKGGFFRITSIPAGKYKLELFDYPDMKPIHIDVPDTKGKAHNVGNVVIKTIN